MSVASFLFSLIFAIVWVGSLLYDVQKQPRLGHSWYIYKLVMLTNLNFVLDAVYSVLVLLTYTGSTKIKQLADLIFFSSVFPVGFLTCVLFWGLYFLDPESVMPEWVAKLIPNWLNHVTHTLPLVYIYGDIFFHNRKPLQTGYALKISALQVFIYFAIIFCVRHFDGYWLYPLLEEFTTYHFIGTYVITVIGFYYLTESAKLTNWSFFSQEKLKYTKPKTPIGRKSP